MRRSRESRARGGRRSWGERSIDGASWLTSFDIAILAAEQNKCSAERNLRRRLVADDGDAVTLGELDDLWFFENDRLARLEDHAGGASGAEFFNRRSADRRHIETHVLILVGDLDAGPAAGFAERAGALDHGIRAFKGFDGDHLQVQHGDGLADVHAADRGASIPAVADVFPLFRGRLAARHDAGGRKVLLTI